MAALAEARDAVTNALTAARDALRDGQGLANQTKVSRI